MKKYFFLLAALALTIVAVVVPLQLAPQLNHQPVAQAQPGATSSPPRPAVTNRMNSPVPTPAVLANNPNFQPRPFPVAFESATVQWTLADGRDTNVIRQLAHNPSEYGRMVTENSEIFRRQLVYLKETAGSVFEQAKLTGAAVARLTLPGLDGQEFTVEVTRTDLRNGGSKGQIYGQLPDRPDSMVTVAFVNNREAFTIISPRDQIYLQAESREPGQVVIKSINPQTYGIPRN
jgi:hypothetical protein